MSASSTRMLNRILMSLPRASVVKPGVAVNIVLKADQRTGKLTTGRVADILTRGDHPRGIKVRLQDGQIGRVQSMSNGATPSAAAGGEAGQDRLQGFARQPVREQRTQMQQDYRTDAVPEEERSLEDYVTFKPAKTKKRGRGGSKETDTEQGAATMPADADPQEILQQEFPGVDSSLIAAILGDSQSTGEARKTLASIS